MLTMFTAFEARATAYLISPEDYSLYQHIEIRIADSVQNGGTSILYSGPINGHVVAALRALGYEVTYLQYQGQDKMLRIEWSHIMCPDSLICPKEVKKE